MAGDCTVEELAHTSEIGLRVHAPSAEKLFSCMAAAMFGLLDATPDADAPKRVEIVEISATDSASLMVDWLSELLYLHEVRAEILTGFTILAWTPTTLRATVTGQTPATPPSLQIKAVTYHQLHVTETMDGWTGQVYFDI